MSVLTITLINSSTSFLRQKGPIFPSARQLSFKWHKEHFTVCTLLLSLHLTSAFLISASTINQTADCLSALGVALVHSKSKWIPSFWIFYSNSSNSLVCLNGTLTKSSSKIYFLPTSLSPIFSSFPNIYVFL